MIDTLFVCESPAADPYANLAAEQVLLEGVREGQCILYLWQNENTVVIGRNQNPWSECRTGLLEAEGCRLARRLSGGGAVFHDLGNLNFTFLLPQDQFDIPKQTSVIQEAVASFGIDVQWSGRNDLLAEGQKFSGNAFYKNGKQAYHHGTLLVRADLEKLGRYLSPSKAKLRSKGVESVRSRVCNLSALNPDITIDALKAALVDAFSRVYGLPVQRLELPEGPRMTELTARNRSWDWNYGQRVPFTAQCEARFPFGQLQLQLQVREGRIILAKVHTDAMDWSFASKLEALLTGLRLDRAELEEACQSSVFAAPEAVGMILDMCL